MAGYCEGAPEDSVAGYCEVAACGLADAKLAGCCDYEANAPNYFGIVVPVALPPTLCLAIALTSTEPNIPFG